MPDIEARAVSLLFFLLAGPFLVLAHEGGHYAAARLLGWRVPIIAWGGVAVRLSPLRKIGQLAVYGPLLKTMTWPVALSVRSN